jgi:quercetin dioxygenase-like cupin family protein
VKAEQELANVPYVGKGIDPGERGVLAAGGGPSRPLSATDGAARAAPAGQVHRVDRRRVPSWRRAHRWSGAIVEHPFPPGPLVPPRVHTREDEFSIVTAGAIGFRSGPHEVVLEPGGYIVKPRGELHTMWNAGAGEARMIEVITPAGFERFFAELADMVEAGPPDPDGFEALAKRYGLFIDPTWVPELMEKYHLNSPFG